MSARGTTTAEEELEGLRSGRPWQEAFEHACKVEDGEQAEGWDDASLIVIYKECLVCGLTFEAGPEAFLEVCKRLSRLLFRYGRAREANNYLLQLRDLSPDPSRIPAWAWAYSAKLAYLEDIEYCITRPREVLDFIQRAVSTNASSEQAPAVLADFINIAVRHLSDRSEPEAAGRLSASVRDFLKESSVRHEERIDRALFKLDLLLEPDGTAEAAEPDLHSPASAPELLWNEEVEQLRAQLEEATGQAGTLSRENETLKKRNQELRLELHLLREQSAQETTSFTQLATLIGRLDTQLEKLRSDWQTSQYIEPERPQTPAPVPSSVSGTILPVRSRIIVIGKSHATEQHLLGICKAVGLDKDQVDFRLSYKAFDSLEIGALQYNDSVAGILIGPVPHKVPGQDDPVQALMRQEGFPPTVRVETSSGELKITKSSFREALENLLTRIASLEPSIH